MLKTAESKIFSKDSSNKLDINNILNNLILSLVHVLSHLGSLEREAVMYSGKRCFGIRPSSNTVSDTIFITLGRLFNFSEYILLCYCDS